MLPRDRAGYQGQTEAEEKEGVGNAIGGAEDLVGEPEGNKKGKQKWREEERDDNPLKKTGAHNPGAGWQPDAWTPKMPVKK